MGTDPLIHQENPTGPDLSLLFARHTADMHIDTPPESIHMMDAGQLAVPQVAFFVLREAGVAQAMGAFKRLSGSHAEIKSMRTPAVQRREGAGRAILNHIISETKMRGYKQLSLETGPASMFASAHKLYKSAGFRPCGPFGDYQLDPHSVFMTMDLQSHVAA